ncbi:MAG: WecB/TagA/CpsF family glycosyltransferase [Verrucomicrobiota bacterium]
MTPNRTTLLGCPVDLMTSHDFLHHVVNLIERHAPARVIQFVNANKIARISEDPAFGRLMWRADYVFADGQPMLPLARALAIRIPERIDGIGLMEKLLRLADTHGYRVFFWGAKQAILEACVEKIRRELPGVEVAGYRNGYFQPQELPEIVAGICATRPDIVFLGMGSPMKEELADRYRDALGASIVQGVGGSFDVMAGLVPRAPIWMQKLGMEWLFRVIQEPRRMFWRYTVTNAVCLRVFAAALLRRTFRLP